MSEHKWGDQLRVGDVIRALGGAGTITKIRPYGPSDIEFIDDRWTVIESGGSWSMTNDPDAGWVRDEYGAWSISHRRRTAPGNPTIPSAAEGSRYLNGSPVERGGV